MTDWYLTFVARPDWLAPTGNLLTGADGFWVAAILSLLIASLALAYLLAGKLRSLGAYSN